MICSGPVCSETLSVMTFIFNGSCFQTLPSDQCGGLQELPNAFAQGTGTVQASEYPSQSPFGQPSIQSYAQQTSTFAAGQSTGTVQARSYPRAFSNPMPAQPSGHDYEEHNAFAAPTQASAQPFGLAPEQPNAAMAATPSGHARPLSLPRMFTNASHDMGQAGSHGDTQDQLADEPIADEENNVFAQVICPSGASDCMA